MLSNAAILTLQRRTGQTPTGSEIFGPVLTAAGAFLRGFLSQVTNKQRWNLGATIKDAEWVIMVPKTFWGGTAWATDSASGLTGQAAIATGDMVTLRPDGETATRVGQVVTVNDLIAPGGAGLSHWEVYLKRISPAS